MIEVARELIEPHDLIGERVGEPWVALSQRVDPGGGLGTRLRSM